MKTAKAENRLPSEDEKKQFADLEKEVKEIDATIAMYDQMAGMSMKKIPDGHDAMTDAERDRKTFENAIGIESFLRLLKSHLYSLWQTDITLLAL